MSQGYRRDGRQRVVTRTVHGTTQEADAKIVRLAAWEEGTEGGRYGKAVPSPSDAAIVERNHLCSPLYLT